jgi:hypothetical protein
MENLNIITEKRNLPKNEGFKMIVENKNIDLLSMVKPLEPTKMEVWRKEILEIAKKEVKQEVLKQKRALNPTISKLVSDQKRDNLNKFKSDAKNVLIATKSLLKQIKDKDLSVYENEELIKKCNTFVNFITASKNSIELETILNLAKKSKLGFYSEGNFSSIIQNVVKISISKNKDFKESINYFEALQKSKK